MGTRSLTTLLPLLAVTAAIACGKSHSGTASTIDAASDASVGSGPGVSTTVLFIRGGAGTGGLATGPLTPGTSNDASLAVAGVGKGRVACHLDRNTFFNTNGAGTSIRANENAAPAKNRFLWHARRT